MKQLLLISVQGLFWPHAFCKKYESAFWIPYWLGLRSSISQIIMVFLSRMNTSDRIKRRSPLNYQNNQNAPDLRSREGTKSIWHGAFFFMSTFCSIFIGNLGFKKCSSESLIIVHNSRLFSSCYMHSILYRSWWFFAYFTQSAHDFHNANQSETLKLFLKDGGDLRI